MACLARRGRIAIDRMLDCPARLVPVGGSTGDLDHFRFRGRGRERDDLDLVQMQIAVVLPPWAEMRQPIIGHDGQAYCRDLRQCGLRRHRIRVDIGANARREYRSIWHSFQGRAAAAEKDCRREQVPGSGMPLNAGKPACDNRLVFLREQNCGVPSISSGDQALIAISAVS